MTAQTLGIPTLDLAYQASGLVAPVTKWGSVARSAPMVGTYHFYTADYKFHALTNDPARVIASGCRVAVEPNFSTQPGRPFALVLADVHRKRAMAARWQRAGIRTIVDLNVEPEFRAVNLLGVPRGWGAYAVRTQAGIGWDQVEADHRAASELCGADPPLFIVFGGGKASRAYCEARDWTHVPEPAHVAAGRQAAYG